MSKIQVNLMFSADTSAAVNNIQQLNQLLSQIGTTTTIGVDGGAIQSAVSAAQQLQIHLQKAVNVNTGKIDLSKLNTSLKASNTDLKTLMGNLSAAGSAGQQSFLKMATAIAQAEAPMMRINQRLKNFGTTLLNTIKWQIASTMIHSVSGMLSSATRHAEDLNRALNDIRIVTGQSTDEMTKFAMQASDAAKKLSTTTTEYAKAALIFYQQGLSGSDVIDRADVVIKLAQVTGQSAEMVSDQMTAIWNNFDDGSKSLEYYADVLTKLGADTAASTDEIAEGMEKFAAVAETVGLSYEYAAASVATVIDKTRQSADVVGTSFKTIFARMQGLSLGETLEDGVDLNKYSEALAKVGINVLDASGQMRDMDDILDELGEKWNGFGETTQIALAQTVGGIRQYNQMIALMDNWDAVVENIDKAAQSTGELAKQQEIWGSSYEAASNRVKQAQNELYEKFIDDKSIVKLTDMFASLINGVSSFIDSMGGVGPMLLMLVGIFSKSLFPMVQAGFKSLARNIAVLTGKAQMDMTRIQAETSQQLTNMMSQSGLTDGQRQQIEITQKLLNAKKELAVASKHMSFAQQEEAKAAMQNYEIMAAQTQQSLERKAQLEQEIKLLKEKMNAGSMKKTVAATAAFDTFRREKGSEEETYADAVIADASDSSRSIASTKKELSTFDIPVGDGSADSVAKKEMIKTLNEQIIAQEQRIAEIIAQDQSTPGSETEAKTLELLAQEEIKLEALKEDQANIDELLEERKKHLTDVLRLQEDIVKESKKDIKDIAVDEVSSSAFSDSFYGEGKDTVDLGRGMTNNIASKLTRGTDADTGRAKSAEVVGGTDTTIGNVVADASLANLEQLYALMGQYKTQISELTAMETDLAQMDFSYIAEETAAQQELETSTAELKAAKRDYQKIVKKEGPDSEKAKKALTQLQKAEDKYKSSLEKSNKAKDKAKKAGKDYGKTLDSLKKKINDMAKAAGQSDDDLQELNQAFEDLKNGTDAGAALDIIKNKLGILKTATTAADGSLDQMAVSMRESLMGAGFSGAQLDSMIAKLQELGIIAPEVANRIRVLNEQGDKLGDGQKITGGQKVASVITSIGTVAGTVAMSVSALSGMISTMMNPDASGMEKAVSILMTLSTVVPAVATAITFLSAVMKAKNTLESQGIAITGKNIAAQLVEIGVISAKTAATWGNTLANIANLLSSPWTWAIAAVAIAAIIGVSAMLSANTQVVEANTQANLENAEAAQESCNKWTEQIDTMDELLGKYKKLTAGTEEYKQAAQDIIDQVPELITAYEEAAQALNIDIGQGSQFDEAKDRLKRAAAVGNVEDIEAAQNELDNLISPEAAKVAQEGYTASVKQLGQSLVDTQGSFSNNKYTVHVGGWSNIFDGSDNEETEARNILVDTMGSDKVKKEQADSTTWGGAGVGADLTLDMSTNDKFVEDYENLLAARNKMLKDMSSEDLEDSGIYEEVNELIENTKEEYEKVKEMQAEAKKYGVYDAKAELEAQGMDITEIDSLEEYEAYKKALMANSNVAGDPQAEAVAEQWLEANANVSEYVKAQQKIGYAGDKAKQKALDLGMSEEIANQAKNDAEKLIRDIYDTFEDDLEKKELLMEVDFNKYQTEAAIKSEVDRLQGIANQDKIQLKIDSINTAQKTLKENGMTSEDWNTVKNSGIDWGNKEEDIIEFTDFLKMSYKDQQSYLEQMANEENAALIESVQAAKATLQANLESLDKNSATYKQDYDAIQAQIKTEEERLAILQKSSAEALQLSLQEAGSLDELIQKWNKLLATNENVDYSIYANGLIALGEAYSTCSDEVSAFQSALKSGNAETIKSAQENLEAAIMLEDAAKKYDVSAEELSIQAQQMAIEYGLNAKAAAKLAIENQRMNKGVSALSENWEDWKKTLTTVNKTLGKVDKTTGDWAKSAAETTKAIADLVGASEDLVLPAEFFDSVENMELIEKAAKGDEKAINALGLAVASAQIEMMQWQEDMTVQQTPGGSKFEVYKEAFDYWQNDVINGIKNLQANLDSVGFGEDVYDILGGEDWVAALNSMAMATGMSVEQMNSMLNSMGVQAEVKTAFKDTTINVPWYKTQETVTGDGTPENPYIKESHVVAQGFDPVQGQIEVAQINTGDSIGNAPKISYVGNGRVSPSSTTGGGGGGGGGSSPKKADKVKKKDIVERYKEVTDSLDDNADAIERANRAAEKLYGKDRINYMREANELLQEEIGLLEQKREEAERYIQEDGDALATAAAEAGINFTFDDKGNIINYTEEMTKLYNQLNDAITRANADGNADEAEQEAIDKIQEKIDNVQDALADYEETRETIEDIDKELEEKLTEWQDANFEILNAELELKIELNEKELERVEYYLGKIEEDFYSMAEAASLMSDRENGQLGIYLSDLRAQEEYVQNLSQAYAAGEISEAKYIEGLSNANSTIYEKLNNLKELDTTMKEYYSETLSMASEELVKYTDLMSHSTSVLEHYYSIAEMLGKSTDYAYLKQILQGQSEVAKQTYIASKANYEMLKAQAQDRQQAYENALANGASEEQLKFLEQQWWDAQTAANEAQDQMLSDAQAWGESLRAVLDNELSDISQNLENILTEGFGSFDAMNTAFERRNSLQEEYLTTTNKIYETNKMMRTAQQQIDKTTNQMAKNKLKQFINETSAMQKQGKLSQYELDIQQAKYQLLLAEIALKEAQNAKSTVRLQRDSEGNFGYVYTADQNKIAEAQQKFEDAENALYNKALEGANNYVQKYQETMAEMQDTLTQMHQDYLDGAYESEEEYNRAIEEAKEYYYQKMLDYSDLYKVAVETDAKAAEEAWSSEFATITDNTDYYMQEVSKSIGIAKVAIDEWKTSMEIISDETLGDIATSVQDVVNESQDLASAVTEQVIPALEEQLNAVTDVTDAYASYKDSLSDIIKKYEDMARESQNMINSLANVEAQARETARAISTAYTATPDYSDYSNNSSTGGNSGGNQGSYPGGYPITKTVTAVFSDQNLPVKKNGQEYIKLQSGGYALVSLMKSGTLVNYGSRHMTYEKTLQSNQILASLDTGGYTGEWGPYGKMAMLHEKELVLNANDTENFLASIEFLHKILEIIDLQTMSTQIGGILSSPNLNHNNSNIIEQDVHIEATFPNVTNHSEIEEAFNNLINTSSQYAFKR